MNQKYIFVFLREEEAKASSALSTVATSGRSVAKRMSEPFVHYSLRKSTIPKRVLSS
ncbi:MAG: hypothetical protein OXH36_03765 [Bdellovibrionales bacterium]|nr:hypothetical protein [Bdellovibrionales bacterium]